MGAKSNLKSGFFKLIDVLPDSIGYALYHFVQKKLTDSTKSKILANEKSFEFVKEFMSKHGGLNGKTLLEIGSGWMPIMPYFLHYKAGAGKIFTFDINDHYQNKYIDELNAYFKKELKEDVIVSDENLHLPDFVKYHPNSNVITAELPEKVDLIFSRFVLEHVTPADILAMHKRFAEIYGSDVYILHLISPSDHRAFSDSSISHYDFLKYSQNEWNRIQTKFDYHNRLRLPQYLDLFDQAGMEVIYLENDMAEPGSKKHDMFKRLNIHPDFAKFSDAELTAGSINVLLRKKEPK